jgi:hypothetical protein
MRSFLLSFLMAGILAFVILSAGCTSGPSEHIPAAPPINTTPVTRAEPAPAPASLPVTPAISSQPSTGSGTGCRSDEECRPEQPGSACCDGTCYNTTERICCGGLVQVSYYFTSKGRFRYICCNGLLYEQSYGCCNGVPYLVGKEDCCNGIVYNPSRQFCCAGKVFEGTDFSCCNGSIVSGKNRCCGDLICPELLQCCPTKDGPLCHDPALYRCTYYPSTIS